MACGTPPPCSAAFAANLSKADHQAGKTRISADYKTDKAACASQTASANDICMEEAKAEEKVALHELDHGHTPAWLRLWAAGSRH